MIDEEHQIQKAITQYLDLVGVCYWAVPNGGARSMITAKRLKAEGVKAGVPDLTIVHQGRYIGLEVKKPKTTTPAGRLSAIQKKMIERIEADGGYVAVVYGVKDVIDLLGRLENDAHNGADIKKSQTAG